MDRDEKIELLKRKRNSNMADAAAFLRCGYAVLADAYAIEAMKLHDRVCDLENGGMR